MAGDPAVIAALREALRVLEAAQPSNPAFEGLGKHILMVLADLDKPESGTPEKPEAGFFLRFSPFNEK
jgi:hypothetical protein